MLLYFEPPGALPALGAVCLLVVDPQAASGGGLLVVSSLRNKGGSAI